MREHLDFALHLAAEAEKIILPYYQSPNLDVQLKRDRSVVTDADRGAEAKIREWLLRERPDDGVLGEELGEVTGKSGYRWIIDPIDGTQSFVCGVPLFGTLIGLTFNNEPVVGVVNFPGLQETYSAAVGEGAWWRPSRSDRLLRARVSETRDPKQALLCATSFDGFQRAERPELWPKLLENSGLFRGWGDCYGHMLVATGRADVMVDAVMHLWDCVALAPILREAGGHFFDLQGQERVDGGSAISTNAHLFSFYRDLVTTPNRT